MGDEKFRYYVPFLITDLATGNRGFGHTFTTRRAAIETQEDVEDLIRDLAKQSGLSIKGILILDWKRIQ
jgi:hypothetical protein